MPNVPKERCYEQKYFGRIFPLPLNGFMTERTNLILSIIVMAMYEDFFVKSYFTTTSATEKCQ